MKCLLVNPKNAVSLYGDYAWQPLALAYLAGAAPPDWEIVLWDEQVDGPCVASDVDLVAITAFTTQATRAYAIARDFRARGVPVVMGGIHATMRPDEALQHVDAIVTGEGETTFAKVLADAALHRLQPRYTAGFADLGPADLVIEAATENEATKREIFSTLCASLRPDAIVATNTSSISITRLAAATDRPERFIGIHFMNPVPVMQLVELIRGIATEDSTYESA